MSSPIRVAITGATGHNGTSIVNGLLASETKFVSQSSKGQNSCNNP